MVQKKNKTKQKKKKTVYKENIAEVWVVREYWMMALKIKKIFSDVVVPYVQNENDVV